MDIVVWLIIHLGISYLCVKISISFFKRDLWWFKTKNWEYRGKVYKRVFKVRKWKSIVPDGGGLFKGGFPKKNLEGSDPQYLKTFFYETKRAELTHWLAILPAPIFFLWNIWWVGIIMIAYALIANIPCVLLQIYNRARLYKLIWNY
ncbi:MAG: glycosyl-4,4'-diaponeurosporenoate acyltransferase [Actinobacteria bacterium]|nr:glycosyl-4,4'-diaponeurosporenoate acyltransferase [Actinomycetota bacterium]